MGTGLNVIMRCRNGHSFNRYNKVQKWYRTRSHRFNEVQRSNIRYSTLQNLLTDKLYNSWE